MASRRLSSVLALEVESADRPSTDRQGDSGVDPPHLSRESAVGRASNSIGTAPTRVKCDGKDRGEISGETRQASLADLEDISCQSCESDCGRRLFHDPDDQFPRFVLVPRQNSILLYFQQLRSTFFQNLFSRSKFAPSVEGSL